MLPPVKAYVSLFTVLGRPDVGRPCRLKAGSLKADIRCSASVRSMLRQALCNALNYDDNRIRAFDWPLANGRITAMSDTTIGLDQTEEEMLAFEVSDETLETAAGTGSEKAGNYTLWYCTALNLCPGP